MIVWKYPLLGSVCISYHPLLTGKIDSQRVGFFHLEYNLDGETRYIALDVPLSLEKYNHYLFNLGGIEYLFKLKMYGESPDDVNISKIDWERCKLILDKFFIDNEGRNLNGEFEEMMTTGDRP